jgi:hypothetical protein
MKGNAISNCKRLLWVKLLVQSKKINRKADINISIFSFSTDAPEERTLLSYLHILLVRNSLELWFTPEFPSFLASLVQA